MSQRHLTMPLKKNKTCTFEGCEGKAIARSLCKTHWTQWRFEKPLTPIRYRRIAGTLPEITYTESPCPVKGLKGPCWIFSGRKNDQGYGIVSFCQKGVRVHVYMWLLKGNTLTKGLVLDHRCRVRACCNPKHLREVTKKINALENNNSPPALNAKKTHCRNGHKYNYVSHNGYRRCLVCDKIRDKGRKR